MNSKVAIIVLAVLLLERADCSNHTNASTTTTTTEDDVFIAFPMGCWSPGTMVVKSCFDCEGKSDVALPLHDCYAPNVSKWDCLRTVNYMKSIGVNCASHSLGPTATCQAAWPNCKADPEIMMKRCPITCGVCNATTTMTTTDDVFIATTPFPMGCWSPGTKVTAKCFDCAGESDVALPLSDILDPSIRNWTCNKTFNYMKGLGVSCASHSLGPTDTCQKAWPTCKADPQIMMKRCPVTCGVCTAADSAKKVETHITGHFGFQVSAALADKMIKDPKFKTAVHGSVVKVTGAKASHVNITSITKDTSRRLTAQDRRLASVGIKVHYKITVPHGEKVPDMTGIESKGAQIVTHVNAALKAAGSDLAVESCTPSAAVIAKVTKATTTSEPSPAATTTVATTTTAAGGRTTDGAWAPRALTAALAGVLFAALAV